MNNSVPGFEKKYLHTQLPELSTKLCTHVYTSNNDVVPFEIMATEDLCTFCTAPITSINELLN